MPNVQIKLNTINLRNSTVVFGVCPACSQSNSVPDASNGPEPCMSDP